MPFFHQTETFYRKSPRKFARHFDPSDSFPYGIYENSRQMQFPSRRTKKGKNEIDRSTNQNGPFACLRYALLPRYRRPMGKPAAPRSATSPRCPATLNARNEWLSRLVWLTRGTKVATSAHCLFARDDTCPRTNRTHLRNCATTSYLHFRNNTIGYQKYYLPNLVSDWLVLLILLVWTIMRFCENFVSYVRKKNIFLQITLKLTFKKRNAYSYLLRLHITWSYVMN